MPDEKDMTGLFPLNQSGVVAELGMFGDDALLNLEAMARIFDRHPRSIMRAVERGDLPHPFKSIGEKRWRVGNIRDLMRKKQAEAIRQAENREKRRESQSLGN